MAFETEQQQVERAAATARQQLGELNPDIYSEQEIGRRREAALAKFEEVAAGQLASVEQAVQHARDELAATEIDDPVARLTPEQLAKAESRRWIIEEDAAQPWDEVTPRLRAALVANDFPVLCLWQRYLGRRLARQQEQARGRMDLDGTVHGGNSHDSPPADLFDAWHQLQQRMVNPQREERRKRAEQTIGDAMTFQYFVLIPTRQELTGEQAKLLAQHQEMIGRAF